MQIMDLLVQSGGLSSIARELGISEQQAATGAAALLPAIVGGFRKQAQASSQGAAGLGGLLEQLGGGGLLDEVLSPQPTPVEHGNNVLGQIFGSKDVSRAVAGDASARTGLDSALLKKMLPMLAMLAAGSLAKRGRAGAGTQAGGGLGGLLGGLMGVAPERRQRRVLGLRPCWACWTPMAMATRWMTSWRASTADWGGCSTLSSLPLSGRAAQGRRAGRAGPQSAGVERSGRCM